MISVTHFALPRVPLDAPASVTYITLEPASTTLFVHVGLSICLETTRFAYVRPLVTRQTGHTHYRSKALRVRLCASLPALKPIVAVTNFDVMIYECQLPLPLTQNCLLKVRTIFCPWSAWSSIRSHLDSRQPVLLIQYPVLDLRVLYLTIWSSSSSSSVKVCIERLITYRTRASLKHSTHENC